MMKRAYLVARLLFLSITILSIILMASNAAFAAESGDSLFKKAIDVYQAQKFEAAADAFGKAGSAYVKEKNNQKAAQCFYNQGLCLSGTSQSESVIRAFEQAADLYKKSKDSSGESQSLLQAAQLYLNAMQWDKAQGHYERSLKIAGKDPLIQGMASEGLGRIQREKGNLSEAEKLFKTAENSYKNNLGGKLRVRLQLAYITGLRGREAEALSIYESVIKDAQELRENEKTRDEGSLMVFFANSDKGEFLLGTGAFDEARKTLENSLSLGEKLGEFVSPNSEAILNLRNDYAQSLMYLGDFAGAEKELNAILTTAAGTDNNIMSMKVNAALGTLARMRGNYNSSFVFFQNFRALAENAGNIQSLGQALIQLANLYAQTGVWNEAAAYYQEAFYTALKAQDMDATLRALQGIHACDIRSELGLVGKVDYRSSQGIPWRSALTARNLMKKSKRDYEDRGFLAALKTVDSARGEHPIPSLDGFRAIREIALRAAPEVRDYYNEVKISWSIGDAVLRGAESRIRAARGAEEALRELAARSNEASDERYVKMAFGTTLNLLRSLAGEEMLSAPGEGFSVQVGGIMLEETSPSENEKTPNRGFERDIHILSRMIAALSPKAGETEEMQKALLAAAPMPESIKTKLRKAIFARASKPSPPVEDLRVILYRILESTHPSLKKEAGRLADKGGKLYSYAAAKLERQREELWREADTLLPKTSPYMLLSIDSGEDMLRYLDAWQRTRRRVLIMNELGVSIQPNKDWAKFLSDFGGVIQQAGDIFKKRFTLSLDETDSVASSAERLRVLAEKLAFMELIDEGRNIASILSAKGNISYDDRMSTVELQSRIRYALSSPEKAEESAMELLSMLSGTSADVPLEVSPEMQWRVYGMMARAADGRHDYGEASRLYGVALSRLDAIHPLEGTTSQSASDRSDLYGGAIRASYELWKMDSSQENIEKLWLNLESMKSRLWREMLATTGGEFLNALPPEDREQVREFEARRVALEGAYRRASFAGQREEMTRINDEIRGLREKRVQLTRNRTVDVDEVPGIDAVTATMPEDWGLVNYYISPSLSFAILLKGGDSVVIPLDIDYDSLFGYSYWMRYVGEDQNEYDENKFPGRGRPRVTACGLSPEDVASVVFQPVADACGDLRKLLIVPHDILYVLPLEALQQIKDGNVSFLISDWTFAELPSAFLLTRERKTDQAERALMIVANPAYATLLGERTWKRALNSLRIAVAGDPEFKAMIQGRVGEENLAKAFSGAATEEEQAAISAALKDVWENILSETDQTSSLASTVKKDFGLFMNPLNNTQNEADDVKRLWKAGGDSDPTVLLMSHASEGEFWDNDPGQYRYVHIACHGYDRGSIPDLQPGLALSPVRDPGNDSFLQMGELSSVKWNAELVTLSACETGLGDLYVGDGMFGLSTVLLAGGAKGAILTRWRAVDESASVFMREFYAKLFGGESSVEALRAAQLSILRDGDFPEPRHWAIFKYVGIPW
jgi:CHAT domain-containing protein